MNARFLRSVMLGAALAVPPAVLAQPAGAAAPAPFSDRMCPTASEPVRAFDAVQSKPDTPVADYMTLLRKVIDVYDRCAKDFLVEDHMQPDNRSVSSSTSSAQRAHYAQVRMSQYLYKSGQVHALLAEYASAREDLVRSKQIAQAIIDWRSANQVVYRSNNVNGLTGSAPAGPSDVSNYRQAAQEIVKSDDAELAKLPGEAAGDKK